MPINMSHCRFENTSLAVQQLLDYMGDNNGLGDISMFELKAAIRLLKQVEIFLEYSSDIAEAARASDEIGEAETLEVEKRAYDLWD